MYTCVEFVKTHEDAKLPTFGSTEAAGMDLYAVGEYILLPGEIQLISTGFDIALSKGFEAQVRPRSGLALKHGITVLNSPGTIDSDYRGALGVILINHGKKNFPISSGDRIAQMVVKPVCTQVVRLLVKEFTQPDTIRGTRGLGSTGV